MSSRLGGLKPREVLRALRNAGFEVHHITGSHYVLKNRQRPELRVTLPWHGRDLKTGTLLAIIEQAGLTVDKFKSFL
jgi:predicted RNA binding protein YcfA (HicA-like mRNA interferase family)